MDESNEEHFDGHVAVKALVRCEGEILLVKGKKHNERWDFAGGHLHHAESAEKCLVRELQEELGVDGVPNKLFFTEQFYHPVTKRQTMMLVYEVLLLSKEITIAEDELEATLWQSLEQIDEVSIYQNCANAIEYYKDKVI